MRGYLLNSSFYFILSSLNLMYWSELLACPGGHDLAVEILLVIYGVADVVEADPIYLF